MTFEEFRNQLGGTVIEPQDEAYEQARAVLMRKGSPKLIVMALSPEDVALALAYAQSAKLKISVRSGGHAVTGLSTNDGGIIVDVSRMNKVELLDEQSRVVRIGAGAQWGDIARQLYDWGLAISSGDTKSVGASGLVLGGGGNFGVLTAIECIAQPVTDIYYGFISYDVADAPSVLKAWRTYMRTAPEELTTSIMIVPANVMGEHPAMCMVQCCWAGVDESEMQAAIAPLRTIGTVVAEDIARKPYYEVLEEAHPPADVRIETNNALFNDLSDETIDRIVDASNNHRRVVQIRSLSGAINRIPADKTAFAHRGAEVMVLMPTFVPLDATEAEVEKILQPYWDVAVDADGAYLNFMSQVTSRERAMVYPPATYARLAAIKAQYDPDNIFDHNLNIVPHKDA